MNGLALTMESAAEALGVSYDTLRGWVREGRIPFFKVGRRVMFRVHALEAWMDEREAPAHQQPPPSSSAFGRPHGHGGAPFFPGGQP